MSYCVLWQTALTNHRIYFVVYKTACHLVFRTVGPLLVLTVLNCCLAQSLRDVKRRRQRITGASANRKSPAPTAAAAAAAATNGGRRAGRGGGKQRENITAMVVAVTSRRWWSPSSSCSSSASYRTSLCGWPSPPLSYRFTPPLITDCPLQLAAFFTTGNCIYTLTEVKGQTLGHLLTCWASCLEYPTSLHHRLFVIAHFQTTSQDLSIQSIILST